MDGWPPGGELIVIKRLLADCAWKAHWQFAARRHIAIEDVGDGRTGFAAGKPGCDDGLDMCSSPVQNQRTAGEDKQHDGLARRGYRFKQLLLIPR